MFSPLAASWISPTAARYFPALVGLRSVQRSHSLSGGGLGEPEAVTLCDDDVRVVQESVDCGVCQTNGVTRVEGNYLRPAARRPSKAISNAFNAGFHRMVQRFRPVPVGSRLMIAM